MKLGAVPAVASALAPMLAVAEVIDFEAMEPNTPPRSWVLLRRVRS